MTHTLDLPHNPYNGKLATIWVQDNPIWEKHNYTYRCLSCGQPVYALDLGQVFHHEEPGHVPIPPQLVCDNGG